MTEMSIQSNSRGFNQSKFAGMSFNKSIKSGTTGAGLQNMANIDSISEENEQSIITSHGDEEKEAHEQELREKLEADVSAHLNFD